MYWEFKEDDWWLWEVMLSMFDVNFQIKITIKFWQCFPDFIKIRNIADQSHQGFQSGQDCCPCLFCAVELQL